MTEPAPQPDNSDSNLAPDNSVAVANPAPEEASMTQPTAPTDDNVTVVFAGDWLTYGVAFPDPDNEGENVTVDRTGLTVDQNRADRLISAAETCGFTLKIGA
jgi:hypothetical protein